MPGVPLFPPYLPPEWHGAALHSSAVANVIGVTLCVLIAGYVIFSLYLIEQIERGERN